MTSPDGIAAAGSRVFPLPLSLRRRARRRIRYPGDEGRVGRMSLIQEDPERRVRMANLAVACSFAVNGVAGLQSRLLAATTLRDFGGPVAGEVPERDERRESAPHDDALSKLGV